MPYLFAIVLLLLAAPAAPAQDLDRDGLDDAFEQALLQRFVPSFHLSAGECDGLPASFVPDTAHPTLAAKDGTVHARAFPADGGGVELQYFHLWARDCGRNGHDLDAEHVSALLEAQPDGTWVARLWYAAAHEDTICDQSSGARASTLAAVTRGPAVFISRGKHASYLDAGQCARGCGGDACPLGRPLSVPALVNIGEPGAPLNGATWIASPRWSLGEKLRSDFAPAVTARLDRPHEARVVALTTHLRSFQTPVLVGDTALDGLAHAKNAVARVFAVTASPMARFVRTALARAAQYPGWLIPSGGRDEKSPMSSVAGAAARGQVLYADHCARCHGRGGKGDGPAATYAADLTDDLRTDLNTEGVLFHKIWNGRIKSGKGTTEDIVEYLKVLRMPRQPDAMASSWRSLPR